MAASNSNKSPPEPVWVSAMPAATGLWSMILTFRWKYFVGCGEEVVCLVLILLIHFRERDSHDIADRLESAAEKQWEVHLKTQSIMNRSSEKQLQLQTTRLKTISRDEVKTQSKSQHENEKEKHVGNEIQQENTHSCDKDIDKNKERIINETRTDCKKYISGKAYEVMLRV